MLARCLKYKLKKAQCQTHPYVNYMLNWVFMEFIFFFFYFIIVIHYCCLCVWRFFSNQILATQPTYLGRPWKQYSRTVYMNTYMSGLVQPRGWLEWYGDFALGTLWYGEYRNHGPGARLTGRVTWPGYHIIRDAATANFFTVGRFIDGMSWLPATGIKFASGLGN